MKSRILVVGWLVMSLALSACAFPEVDNPNNPSYRVVTAQVLSIDSAMGMRGGLGALLRGAEPPWSGVAAKVTAIEQDWADIRLELERRAEPDPVISSFESALAALKADVAAKDGSKASRSLSKLSASFEEVKGKLHRADVNGRRLAVVVISFVAVWIVLTVAFRLIAGWRDPRFMLPGRTK